MITKKNAIALSFLLSSR